MQNHAALQPISFTQYHLNKLFCLLSNLNLHPPIAVLSWPSGNPACDGTNNGYISRMLLDEQTSPEQIAVFRRMTPEQRWQAAHRLYWTMRRHKAAFIQSQHPEWSEQRVTAKVREIFSNART